MSEISELSINKGGNNLNGPASSESVIELLEKNNKLVSKQKRFETQAEPFNQFYQKWDQTQGKMDSEQMNNFVELTIQKYKEKKAPLSIADVGCGYGKQAHHMKKRLEASGVEIEKFYGYDISADLIKIAKEKFGSEPNMAFFKRNLDTQFNQVEEFDVVVSFLALHWVNDIQATAKAIARSLKPKGLFLALIGTEKENIYQTRVKFINTSKWAESFEEDQRKVSHCYFKSDIYCQTFQKDFTTLLERDISKPFKMGLVQCVEFLGNWVPEVRHLIRDIRGQARREAIIRSYITDLISSIPVGQGQNLRRYADNTFSVQLGLYEYHGVKN